MGHVFSFSNKKKIAFYCCVKLVGHYVLGEFHTVISEPNALKYSSEKTITASVLSGIKGGINQPTKLDIFLSFFLSIYYKIEICMENFFRFKNS